MSDKKEHTSRLAAETRENFRRMMREHHPQRDRLERNENIVAYFLRKFRKKDQP